MSNSEQPMENDPSDKEKLFNLLDEIAEDQLIQEKLYDEQSFAFYRSLSKEDQLKAFYAVTRLVHHGFKRGLSCRGILYSLFGFGFDAYSVGMQSGFFEIYNHCNIKDKKGLDKTTE